MSLKPSDVEYLAHLARLQVDPAELPGVVDKLTRIVGFVDQLQQVDTAGVEPMAHPLDMNQRLRPDQVTETDDSARYQQNAAQVAEGLYLVPRVIE